MVTWLLIQILLGPGPNDVLYKIKATTSESACRAELQEITFGKSATWHGFCSTVILP